MRACEGCRRRKIKCDAATTNTWPCSACIRLKLHCVRPNGQYDGSPSDQYDPSGAGYDTAAQVPDGYRQMTMPPHQSMMAGQPKGASATGMYPSHGSYSDHHRRSWTFILANFHTEKVNIHSHLVIFLEMLYTLPNSMIFPMPTTSGMVRYSGYILSRIYPGLPSLALSPATRSRTNVSSVPGLEALRFPSIL